MESRARFCQHCGEKLAPDARFCPGCGRPVAGPADVDAASSATAAQDGGRTPTPSSTPANAAAEWRSAPSAPAQEAPRSRAVIYGLASGLLLLALVAVFVSRRGPKVTSAETAHPRGEALLRLPQNRPAGPGLMNLPPGARRPAPPPDPNRAAVAAYLAQVAKIEAARKAVVSDLWPAMFIIASARMGQGLEDFMRDWFPEDYEGKPPKPSLSHETWDTITGYMTRLQQLSQRLRSIRPPEPARNFHATYVMAFGTYIGAIYQVRQGLQAGMTGDPQQALQGLSASKQALSDQTTGALQRAEEQLQALCQRYNLPQQFAIGDSAEAPVTGGLPVM